MLKISCTRRFQFCAGHRVFGHEGKCAWLHGHNYVAFVDCVAPKLDRIGRVIDFSVIKEKVGEWIDRQWDHGFILYEKDTNARTLVQGLSGQKVFVMTENPTAENMAAELMRHAQTLLAPYGISVTSIRMWETENCYADATIVEPATGGVHHGIQH